MADTLTLTRCEKIVIDLKAERDRIKTPRLYNKKERTILLKIIDLFEEGNIKEMVEFAQSEETKKVFNEYPVWEYLGEPYYEIVKNVLYFGVEYVRGANE